MSYDVDMVLLIDTTGSMNPIIDIVKQKAVLFCKDLQNKMNSYQKSIANLRVMVISFKDFYGKKIPIDASRFFELPKDNDVFSNFVANFVAGGGGKHAEYPHGFAPNLANPPESGLEALAYAISQPQFSKSHKKREVLVLWTDAYAHPLEVSHREAPSGYPWMPKSMQELTSLWGSMPSSSKRLILFAPDVYPWQDISAQWEHVIHCISQTAGTTGVIDTDYQTILETIVNSI